MTPRPDDGSKDDERRIRPPDDGSKDDERRERRPDDGSKGDERRKRRPDDGSKDDERRKRRPDDGSKDDERRKDNGRQQRDQVNSELAWEERVHDSAGGSSLMYPLTSARVRRSSLSPPPRMPPQQDKWEIDLDEEWQQMQARLEAELQQNPLEHEAKPFSARSPGVVDGKNADGIPANVVWVPPFEPGASERPKNRSEHLMDAMRTWGLELPNIVLLVQGGASHPYSLVRGTQSATQDRDNFLRSRPHFDESYFNESWMSLGNSASSWRYPSFFLPARHEELRDLHIRPPATLFVDASLQLQSDGEAELIGVGDRSMNEWTMDGVTHQPLGRQPAIKGADGVFYWDLNATALPSGVEGSNLRSTYAKWYHGVHLMGGDRLRHASRSLVGTMKRRNIDAWKLVVAKLLVRIYTAHSANVHALDAAWVRDGEMRIEISALRLNKLGVTKLASLVASAKCASAEPHEDGGVVEDGGSASPQRSSTDASPKRRSSLRFSSRGEKAAVAAKGSPCGSAVGGGVDLFASDSESELVLIKLQVLGGEVLVSSPVRMTRSTGANKVKLTRSVHFADEDGGLAHLNQRLSSSDPTDSEIRLIIVLATANGREARGPSNEPLTLASYRMSLKELVSDQPFFTDTNAHEREGELDLTGAPPAVKNSKGAGSVAPVVLGKLNARVAFSPPDGMVTTSAQWVEVAETPLQAFSPPDDMVTTSAQWVEVAETPLQAEAMEGSMHEAGNSSSSNNKDAVAPKPPTKQHIRLPQRPKPPPPPPPVGPPPAAVLSRLASPAKSPMAAAVASVEASVDGAGGSIDGVGGVNCANSSSVPRAGGDGSADRPSVPSVRRIGEIGSASGCGGGGARVLDSPTGVESQRSWLAAEVASAEQASQQASLQASWQASPQFSPHLPPNQVAPSPPASPPSSPPALALAVAGRLKAGSGSDDATAPEAAKRERLSETTVTSAAVAPSAAAAAPSATAAPPATAVLPATAPSVTAPLEAPPSAAATESCADEASSSSGVDVETKPGPSSVLAVSQAIVSWQAQTRRVAIAMDTRNNAALRKEALRYSVAYWVLWRPVEATAHGDQVLLFGNARNMPAVVRGNRLGILVDRDFRATQYDPRTAGDNWQLVVVADDGADGTIYVGHSSDDLSGAPVPVAAELTLPGKPEYALPTGMSSTTSWHRLQTTGKAAGWVAQAWIWSRDLNPSEVHELWLGTKGRYPAVGQTPPHSPSSSPQRSPRPSSSALALRAGVGSTAAPSPTSTVFGIDKEVDKMSEVPLVNQLAFQRLLNVFEVLLKYAQSTESFIVIDRLQHMSPTAELMLELAMRAHGGTHPRVLVLDCRERLKRANDKLKQLKAANFLRKGVRLQANEYLNVRLRQLVTPQGLTWLRATSSELDGVERGLSNRPEARQLDTQLVRHIYEQHNDGELLRDGRPRQDMIWATFYAASLFASASHYLILDDFDGKGKSILASLGTVGSVVLSGSSAEHAHIVEQCTTGAPILLLESTGGVTQAFAYVTRSVRLLRQKWTTDFVFRLVADYKARAARDRAQLEGRSLKRLETQLENIHLLDRELARLDLLLSAAEQEAWMRSFGLPELLMLFEKWQRAPAFMLRQIQTVDVMKKSSEAMLDVFTGCFSSSAGGVPELGLGNAETKVVATAWNRHLKVKRARYARKGSNLGLKSPCLSSRLSRARTPRVDSQLYHNGNKYNQRSIIIQITLNAVAMSSAALAILVSSVWRQDDGGGDGGGSNPDNMRRLMGSDNSSAPPLLPIPAPPGAPSSLDALAPSGNLASSPVLRLFMFGLPIFAALLGTINVRLRQRQKYAAAKMGAFEIVSEIYKFRTRTVEYNEAALSAMLAAKERAANGGGKKDKDEEAIVKPVSGQERNRVARNLFVERVKAIYTMHSRRSSRRGPPSRTPRALASIRGRSSATATWRRSARRASCCRCTSHASTSSNRSSGRSAPIASRRCARRMRARCANAPAAASARFSQGIGSRAAARRRSTVSRQRARGTDLEAELRVGPRSRRWRKGGSPAVAAAAAAAAVECCRLHRRRRWRTAWSRTRGGPSSSSTRPTASVTTTRAACRRVTTSSDTSQWTSSWSSACARRVSSSSALPRGRASSSSSARSSSSY